MDLTVYLKTLEIWMKQNKDISDQVKCHDVIELLKVNKDVDGLAMYGDIGRYILPVLDTI